MYRKVLVKAGCLAAAVAVASWWSGGCGRQSVSYADGEYTAQSSPDDRGGYGVITLTITQGRISACRYETFKKDGTLKDESYGKEPGHEGQENFYRKAQKAVESMKVYARKLVEVQDLDRVDAISGATISHDQFTEAAAQALEAAAAASQPTH